MSLPTLSPVGPNILALDTATERLALGLQAGGRARCTNAEGGALASASLLPQVQALLAAAGLRFADLDFIAFGRGPGAFTGLRTACAVAQGLALGIGKPVLPIDSLLIVAEDARAGWAPEATMLTVGVAMDARMGEVYAGVYRWQQGQWKTLQAPALHTPASWAAAWAGLSMDAAAGSALDALGTMSGTSGFGAIAAAGASLPLPAQAARLPHEHDRAAALLRLAVLAAAAGAGADAALALPLYLRDKVAQTSEERAAARAVAVANLAA